MDEENTKIDSGKQTESSVNNPSNDEISEIMKDIRAEVLVTSQDEQTIKKSARNAILLTSEMKVRNSSQIKLNMELDELKDLIREVVKEELNER